MGTPALKSLAAGSIERARVISLRNALEPLLARNYLSHFTDHSVTHSDCICDLADNLAAGLEPGRQLTPREGAILYFACYLHDVGLQHERAGETVTVQQYLKSEPRFCGRGWSALELSTKQQIVRQLHHRISAEMQGHRI